MRQVKNAVVAVFAFLPIVVLADKTRQYEAVWESLDSRPVPQWWQDAKFGIFVHWGVYAVPGYAPTDDNQRYAGYSEWYQGRLIEGNKSFEDFNRQHYGKRPYANFAAEFKAEHFNAADWAKLFRRAGAKYAVLTSKHHDGFALWPSPESPYYNAVALGPGRDLAGEFTAAMKDAGLKSGFYFSLLEYANPLYPAKRDAKADAAAWPIGDWATRVNLPQLKELVNRYRADIIWPDGEWDYTGEEHRSTDFLAWLFNASPVRETVVVNDRWGSDCRSRHGGFYTTEYGSDEEKDQAGASRHPWEENRGIGRSYGLNRFETPDEYLSQDACVELLVSAVARGGNLLLNVGPDADGLIPPIMQDRLLAIGRWLDVNGEAIYATRRGTLKCARPRTYCTDGEKARYVIDFNGDGQPITVDGAAGTLRVELVGAAPKVDFSVDGTRLTIVPPRLAKSQAPCEHAWTYRVVGN